MGNFQTMEVWRNSKDLAVKIFKTTGKGKFVNDNLFRDQIRKAAISIPSNLAGGENSGSGKSSIRYFNIASASLAELRTQLEIAKEIGYIRESDYQVFQKSILLLTQSIVTLIQLKMKNLN